MYYVNIQYIWLVVYSSCFIIELKSVLSYANMTQPLNDCNNLINIHCVPLMKGLEY